MCAMIKTDSGNNDEGGRILAKRGPNYEKGWEFVAPRFNGPICFIANDGQFKNIGKTRVDDNTWHHVAVVHDQGTISAYVDGKFDGSEYFDSVGPNSEELWVGSVAHEDKFHTGGMFKDVKCFNRKLTEDELKIEASGQSV